MTRLIAKYLPESIRQTLAHRGLRLIITNTFWLFVDRLLNLVFSFIIGSWVANYLGPDAWGLLGYAMSFVAAFITFAALGLDNIVVRALVRANTSAETILGTVFLLRLLAAVLTFLIVVMIIWQLESDESIRLLVLIAAGNLITVPFSTIDLWFQAQVRSKHIVWVRNIALLASNAAKIILIFGQASVLAFAVANLLFQLMITVGFLLVLIYHRQSMMRWRVSWRVAQDLLRDAWPLIIAGIATTLYLRIDQVILGDLIDAGAVGTYAAAVRLTELWYFVPVAVATSLYPAIVRSREYLEDSAYRQRIQAFYDLIAGLGILATLLTLLFGPALIRMLFGTAFVDAIPILQVHTWSLVFTHLNVARSRWLFAENLTGVLMVSNVLGASINVALNLWLIPQLGGLGAAWATVISYAFAGYFSTLLYRRLWPIFWQLTLALFIPLRLTRAVSAIYDILRSQAERSNGE
ncbi:MAG: flippase [Anaerolineae bacterium]|nr:flippase [Anaerolineae bacterium]